MGKYLVEFEEYIHINEERCAKECPQRLVVENKHGGKDYYCCLSAKQLYKTAGDGDTIRCKACVEYMTKPEHVLEVGDYDEIANKMADQLEFFDKKDIIDLLENITQDSTEDFELGRYWYIRADIIPDALKEILMDDTSLVGRMGPSVISKFTDTDYSLIRTVSNLSDVSDEILGDFAVDMPGALDKIIKDIVWREDFREYFDPEFDTQYKFNHTGAWYYAYRIR